MNNLFGSIPIKSSEITPYSQYLSRRSFLKTAGWFAGSAILAACTTRSASEISTPAPSSDKSDEFSDPITSFEDATNYNNYYEFSGNKQAVNSLLKNFKTDPWTVDVYGLVNKPKTYGLEDLLVKFTQEERIYRLRCVEGWSMVIPWTGFTLSSLLKEVEPTSAAKYVRFEAVYRPNEMKGQGGRMYPWPYQEGLRLDEAMHDLTILATGVYGVPLPIQNGAPIRLVVPWKYGIKSIKAIAKIELTDQRPDTFWNFTSPKEYGFYSNVNPNRPHPRWLQSTERRIGELNRRPTLIFNGYADQVASLYDGLDLMQAY